MSPVLKFFYEIFLFIGAIFILPKGLYDLIVRRKYRRSLFQRFGFGLPSLPVGVSSSVWIHAVSVGETKAIASLARSIKDRFPERAVVISSVTETGHAEAKKTVPFADCHIFMPFDFGPIVSRAIDRLRPGVVLFSETDLWPNFIRFAKKRGATCAMVNGKISERSKNRFKKFSMFSKRLFEMPDLFCVQNEEYRSRFIRTGVPPDKISITGNLKWDERYDEISSEESDSLRKKVGIEPGDQVLTIGSTHDPEENNLLAITEEVRKIFPRLRVILVPRHPERFGYVANLLKDKKIPFVRFSEIDRRTGNEAVILIDRMGLLKSFYAISDIAIVAGSFVGHVGGHNVTEPAGYAKPVIFGPETFTQEESARLILDARAGERVTLDRLQGLLTEWLHDGNLRKEIGRRGFELTKRLRGSTNRTLIEILPLFSHSKKPS